MIKTKFKPAFTIVELLVVIVIIGILAAITIVSYTGITKRAAAAALQSDLKSATTRLELTKATTGSYPLDATGLPKSTGTTYQYTLSGGQFCLSVTSVASGEVDYHVSSTDGSTVEGVCDGHIPGGNISNVRIAMGGNLACTVSSASKVYCWGRGSSGGGLGNGTNDDSLAPVAVSTTGVLSGKTIKAVAAGDSHACAIASDNNLYCWGSNWSGQLGNGNTDSKNVPTAIDMTGVLSGKTIKSVVAGNAGTCVIASDDKAYCWGDNWSGQLGNGTMNNQSYSPTAVYMTGSGVLNNKTIKSISMGSQHACVIASDDKAYCWGENGQGQLGDATTTRNAYPVAVDTSLALNGTTIKSISVGEQHTCAVASDSRAYCWGSNDQSQMGNSIASFQNSTPLAVDTSGVLNNKNLVSVSNNGYHTCVLDTDSKVFCWGYGYYGELGNNTSNQSVVPVAVDMTGVLNNKTVKILATGRFNTCVIASDDKPYCWGQNFEEWYAMMGMPITYNLLGNNTQTDYRAMVPVAVSPLP